MALKGNQGQLNDDVQAWFHKAWREKYQDIPHSVYEHTDAGHGRVEVRKCTQLTMKQSWLTNADKWSHIKTVVCVEAERHVDDKVTTESRYYISSLSLNAERLNSIIRNHWGVENSLHWTLDMTFNEDDSRIRRGNAAEVMNAFRKIVLNIVKQDKSRKASMKRKLKMAALEDDFRAKLLIGAN